ncbi:MAG: glycoside hydrolase [Ruminococcus sp.]|nr:glycoside hydrolase [Ruminococcus sp.]
MKNFKRAAAFSTAFLMSVLAITPASYAEEGAKAKESYDMNVSVDLADEGKAISPYIFGINEHGLSEDVTVNSVRQGGNRFTAYNWETNYSSAGSDWKHSSDTYLSSSSEPADCVQTLSKEAQKGDIDYKLATVQMAGYVAADKLGEVSEEEAAPSDRWNKVLATKGSELSLKPDLTDGVVYMDEYVNYIVNKLGDAESETGIQGYSLDNEPGLWAHTHPRIHADEVTCEELIKKSIETSKSIKSIDPKAEVFGPALFGYTAFVQLCNEDDWKAVNSENKYNLFVSYYLDQMKKAEEESGKRLLDVMDIHYYSEARGECDVRMCADPTHTKCIDEMLQSYRTLIEKGYQENSWIGQWCQQNIPILTTIKDSIDTYYPGTKLAITEYDFGGGKTIAGAIAEVDALGTFAENDVYYATLWAEDVPYQYSAINMFTNYDGNGSKFGNTLIESETDDYVKSTSYAAINDGDQGEVTLILTNKSQTEYENANIDFKNADVDYKNAAVYILSGKTSEIIHTVSLDDIKDNKLTVELPPLSVAQIRVTDDVNEYRPVVEKTEPVYTETEATIKESNVGYTLNFKEKLDGGKLVLDIELESGILMASGCVDTNVKYNGIDYWVSYEWSTSNTGKVEVDLMKPASALDVSIKDAEPTKDEEVLAEIAELIKSQKSLSFQIWYAADSAWEDTDHSKVKLNGAVLKKLSENQQPAETTPVVTTTPAVTTPAETTTSSVVTTPAETTIQAGTMPSDQFEKGDINKDKIVDLTDLSFLSLYLIGDNDFTDEEKKIADMDNNNKVNLADLARLKQFITKSANAE